MRHFAKLSVTVALGVATFSACDRPDPAAPQFGINVIDHVAACGGSTGFSDNPANPNPYFPIGPVGRTWVLEGEEDGVTIRLIITVTARTEQVGSVTTRIVEESEGVAGQPPTEVSENFFAQNADGTVCYFGERDLDGSGWRANTPGNHAGIIMPANPRPGLEFKMEDAPLVAEDEGRITGKGTVRLAVATFNQTIRVREFNPLDGGFGFKVFAKDVGTIVDEVLTLVSCSGGVVPPCTP